MTYNTQIYQNAAAFLSAPQKRILLCGMSGLGKSYLSEMMRYDQIKSWFHYSVDYRIGTRYLGEHIADQAKEEAMKVPYLRELLCSDSIYIASNITFNNLAPLSTFLGKPGDIDKGGIPFHEYMRRQKLHHNAEIYAMRDIASFIERAERIYKYPHFVADSSGSLVEIVNPHDADDPILKEVSKHCLIIWLKGDQAHQDMLVERFKKAPKPMFYQEQTLQKFWCDYVQLKNIDESKVDPNDFMIWGYQQLLENRQPRYKAIADNWGITIDAKDVQNVKNANDLMTLIADQLP